MTACAALTTHDHSPPVLDAFDQHRRAHSPQRVRDDCCDELRRFVTNAPVLATGIRGQSSCLDSKTRIFVTTLAVDVSKSLIRQRKRGTNGGHSCCNSARSRTLIPVHPVRAGSSLLFGQRRHSL